jgi:tryptophan halogenase
MNKNIVVVGGGTAGWLTALMANKTHPEVEITLIESKEIGILGAGEGTTPFFAEFFKYLGIPLSDLVSNCDATVKNGIKFTNWNNDNEFYYHGFGSTDVGLSFQPIVAPFQYISPHISASIALNGGIKQIDFSEKISEKNKVPFIFKKKQDKNPILDYQNIGGIAVHFDATKLANRLKEIGIERGIKVIEETIKDISLDKDKYIVGMVLDNDEFISCDFVFDCSGFHRLIIDKVFNSKWKSYKDFLPVDSAIPFFTEMQESMPAYTEAISMKYGWMWKIPLQSRFGCGYVYDSSLISEEDAVKEIEEFLGYVPTYPRKDKGGFKFSAGSYEETWISNCLSVGLAANFIEPLEATSLLVTTTSLALFFSYPNCFMIKSDKIKNEFNKKVLKRNDDISQFIYFHYMNLRDDTEFWKKFSYSKAPQELKEKIDIWNYRLPSTSDSTENWVHLSWATVGINQGTINKNTAKEYIENSENFEQGLETYDRFVSYQDYKVSQCVDHREFLDSLK